MSAIIVAFIIGHINSIDKSINVFRCETGESYVLFITSAVVISIIYMVLVKNFLNKRNIIIENISDGTLLILALHFKAITLLGLYLPFNIVSGFISSLVIMGVSYILIILSKKYCPILIGKMSSRHQTK